MGAYYPWSSFKNDKQSNSNLRYPVFSDIVLNSKSGLLHRTPKEYIKKARIQELGLISNFYSQYLKSIIEFLNYDEIIPVPAKSEYSYNSVEIIGGEFSECFNIPLITDRMIRVNDDLKEYSIVRENDNLSQKKILLVDDIITDSETKNNIISKFYEKGCTNIDMITLARTDHIIYEYNE